MLRPLRENSMPLYCKCVASELIVMHYVTIYGMSKLTMAKFTRQSKGEVHSATYEHAMEPHFGTVCPGIWKIHEYPYYEPALVVVEIFEFVTFACRLGQAYACWVGVYV